MAKWPYHHVMTNFVVCVWWRVVLSANQCTLFVIWLIWVCQHLPFPSNTKIIYCFLLWFI
jgi:hypothetical protein